MYKKISTTNIINFIFYLFNYFRLIHFGLIWLEIANFPEMVLRQLLSISIENVSVIVLAVFRSCNYSFDFDFAINYEGWFLLPLD